ncbi:hypothetical protein KQX54_012852, partial [Cotesia glomerata]
MFSVGDAVDVEEQADLKLEMDVVLVLVDRNGFTRLLDTELAESKDSKRWFNLLLQQCDSDLFLIKSLAQLG